MNKMTEIQKALFELRDEKYRDFNSSLIPNIESERVIGVRTPRLRAFAKKLRGSGEAEYFVSSLPHFYFEENQLHAFLIEDERDFDVCLMLVNAFLPYIDNWATCDQLSPKCFYKNPEKLLPHIYEWLTSKHTYGIRFGILCLMRYFLDGRFDIKYAEAVASVRSDEYYIKMMVAWYFATALAKQYDATLPFITGYRLDSRTHNKAIQKAIESRRVTDEHKAVLKSCRIDKHTKTV